jgi:hypothetical protein
MRAAVRFGGKIRDSTLNLGHVANRHLDRSNAILSPGIDRGSFYGLYEDGICGIGVEDKGHPDEVRCARFEKLQPLAGDRWKYVGDAGSVALWACKTSRLNHWQAGRPRRL